MSISLVTSKGQLLPSSYDEEFVARVSRVRVLVPIETYRTERLKYVNSVELPLALCDSLKREAHLLGRPHYLTEVQN
ncbi:hypothetical protein TNCV_1078451 [Trichonephila clavipes]|nr:hypothetical protein TNCV_1078451 [Trichonephila clavipes]